MSQCNKHDGFSPFLCRAGLMWCCVSRKTKKRTNRSKQQNIPHYSHTHTHTLTQFMFDGEKSIFGIIMCVNVNSMVRKCNCDVTYWLTLSIMWGWYRTCGWQEVTAKEVMEGHGDRCPWSGCKRSGGGRLQGETEGDGALWRPLEGADRHYINTL